MDIAKNMIKDIGVSIYNSQEIRMLIASVFVLISLFICWLFFKYARTYKVKIIGSVVSALIFTIIYSIMY